MISYTLTSKAASSRSSTSAGDGVVQYFTAVGYHCAEIHSAPNDMISCVPSAEFTACGVFWAKDVWAGFDQTFEANYCCATTT